MSTRRVRCPKCLTEVPTGGGKVASKCPGCGARIAADAADPRPAVPPKRKKLRRRPQQQVGFDWVGPLMSFGAAVGLLVASLGVAGVVALATGAFSGNTWASPGPVPNPNPPDGPQPQPPEPPLAPAWLAKPDPPAQRSEPFTVPDGPGLPLNGDPLFASANGPFVVDTPHRGIYLDNEIAANEGDRVPVIDLRTGRPIGGLPRAARRDPALAVLSSDGRRLAGPAASDMPKGPTTVEVWEVDVDQPIARLTVPGLVLWLDFFGPAELILYVRDQAQDQVQVWGLKKGTKVRDLPVPVGLAAPQPAGTGRAFPVSRLTKALSPGQRYLALGGPTGIGLIDLDDGQIVGELPLRPGDQKVSFQGMRFSPDGTELWALVGYQRPQGGRGFSLRTWTVADGKSKVDVALNQKGWSGPPVPGPKEGTLLLSWVTSDAGPAQISYGGQVIEGGTAGKALDFTPALSLTDGRVLGAGPIKNAPQGTPLPAARKFPNRDDPSVRAIYPVAME